jgi:hypothetical protein
MPNEKPALREKRGLFLDSLEPYGEGHTTGFRPKLCYSMIAV